MAYLPICGFQEFHPVGRVSSCGWVALCERRQAGFARLSGLQLVGNWVASAANFPASLSPVGVIPTTSRQSRRTVCVGKWPEAKPSVTRPITGRQKPSLGGGSFFRVLPLRHRSSAVTADALPFMHPTAMQTNPTSALNTPICRIRSATCARAAHGHAAAAPPSSVMKLRRFTRSPRRRARAGYLAR